LNGPPPKPRGIAEDIKDLYIKLPCKDIYIGISIVKKLKEIKQD
jgi:hypothetical protein